MINMSILFYRISKMTRNADRIKDMLIKGDSYRTIRKEIGVAMSTIAYHAKQIGLQKYTSDAKRYDWLIIQSYYDEGRTISELTKKFGVTYKSVMAAHGRGQFKLAERNDNERKKKLELHKETRKEKVFMDLSEHIFVQNSQFTAKRVKETIKNLKLLSYKCFNHLCILHEQENPLWCGEPIVLHLDHKNGISDDHRLENLRWLCPNCHSMTETYCGRNKRGKIQSRLTNIRNESNFSYMRV